ncbi:MAG: sugar phosphate nucleotidyltransferase [Acidobacteriota bacterium]
MPVRVLLVDDSPHFIESAERFFADELGVDVVGSALSGAEALDLVARLHPDLVLMDVAMPGMDGLEATQRIKALAASPRVIILTLYDTPKYREAAHRAGADGFVPKADFGEKLLPLILELFPDLTQPDHQPVRPSVRLHTRPIVTPGSRRAAPQANTWLSSLQVRTVILAGGEGARLGVLTARRAKPAVPFAAKYRIIDFALSNCVNSGLFDVMLLTQYRPHSLNAHIGVGRPWDLDRGFTGGIRLLHPYKDRTSTDWYSGTADAMLQNLSFITDNNPALVLVLAGDHVYQMNYGPLIAFHAERQADLTIGAIEVPLAEAPRFGILTTDREQRVTAFVEKPQQPPGTVASMGIYVFSRALLEQCLHEDHQAGDSSHDFGKDIIPRLVRSGRRVFAYRYDGYWMDVGTIDSYWQVHMDLLRHPPAFDLNDRGWVIRTRSAERPPMLIDRGASAQACLITDGVVIAAGALVERSVLSPGVYIGPNAVVRDSIVFADSCVEAGAQVERAIIDKHVTVGANARVGRLDDADGLPGITTIGKNVQIAAGLEVERGMAISPDVYLEPEPPLWPTT